MDLRLKDVSELLHLENKQVLGLVSSGGIPSYKLNGEYRFDRSELEKWLLQNNCNNHILNNNSQKENNRNQKRYPGRMRFSLYRSVVLGNIFYDVEGDSKEEVFSNAISLIHSDLNIDPSFAQTMLLQRESVASTSINFGFGVPHSREITLNKFQDTIFIVYPKKFIDYGALDNQKVSVLFFLFASDDNIYIKLMAKIALLISNEDNRLFFQSKPSKQQAVNLLRSWESKNT